MRNKKLAETMVPKIPPNCSRPELLLETAVNTVFSATMIPTPMATTTLEWPREKKYP